MRHPTPAGPSDAGTLDGLAWTLWLPAGAAWAGVTIVHGAGSSKESHHDFARVVRDAGAAAVCLDLRGHGESDGALGGRAVEDVAAVAGLLPEGVPRVLRGSSMGGYLAILAAERTGAAAVVAICPAGAGQLLRGLRGGDFEFRADRPALEAFLAEHPLEAAVERLDTPLLLLHAEGDERVPAAHSRALAAVARQAKLVIVPGGHHRSVQHDAELQGLALRWLRRALAPGAAATGPGRRRSSPGR
jgi:pimeloyl-ACP methyl ester carboxylesterase